MKYLKQMTIILAVTLMGEVIKYFMPFPIPASIYGLILMFVFLMTNVIKIENIKETGDFLVEIMPVLFIPAAVGLIDMAEELKAMFLPIMLVVGPVTLLVMIVAGKVTDSLIKEEENDE
ncbi:MAG: CidA/LrgA family protein [Agathobacter sp.]|nr:CidA/LrgA family protein [Agathobacter sp.]